MPWLHVEPLHFADAIAQFPDRHASNGLIVSNGQKQLPVRWSVIAGKPIEFLLESLEAEVNAEVFGVLHEKVADGNEMARGAGGDDFHSELSVQFTVHRHQLGRGANWPLGAEADETSLLAASCRNVAVRPEFSGYFESELLQST